MEEKKYQQKIEHLQKYVPFLLKLIERLKTELDSEAKVVQLQLFYNLLICPDPSVTIEDLEKCEEALMPFYNSYHTDFDEPKLLVGEEVNKSSGVELDKNLMDPPTSKLHSEHKSSNDEKVTPIGNSKEINESKEGEKCKDVNEKHIFQENFERNTEDKHKKEEHKIKTKAKSEEENESSNKEHEKDLEKNNKKENNEANTSIVKEREISNSDGNEVNKDGNSNEGANESRDKEEVLEENKTKDKQQNSNIVSNKNENKPADSSGKTTESLKSQNNTEDNIKESSLDQDITQNQSDINRENKTVNNDIVESDNADDDELEENVELVKMPEAESEEMILPDSEGEELQAATVENEEEHESNVTETEEPEHEIDEDVEESNADEEAEQTEDEPLLVAMEPPSDVKANDEEAGDPLNVDEGVNKSEEKEVFNAALEENINKNDDDDDDDDVQVIETRNSPICIDSDDDVPPPIPPASIRKSERNKSISKVSTKQPKTQNFKEAQGKDRTTKGRFIRLIDPKDRPPQGQYVQLIEPKARPPQGKYIDLIELLDSSDEDDSSSAKKKSKSTPKLPMKRCLLPKPIRPTESVSNNAPRQPDKFIAYAPPKPPTQVHISTPQSNFLNAVNLQPANTSNPPAFSTQLSNKNIIIPNAFYGNPPEARGIDKDKSVRKSQQIKNLCDSRGLVSKTKQYNYQGWVENFITNFASVQQRASNSCFVLLQRVLKYKFFQKIRDARMNLDAMAQRPNSINLDVELLRDLQRIFFNSDLTQLSEVGIKFCEFATSQEYGKQIALTTDIKTGRISSRTRGESGVFDGTATASNTIIAGATDCRRKKQKGDDEQDEYTPSNPINENELIGERKRSLRTNRVKRFDNSFSYNEDQEDTEDEEDDSYAAVKRKVEQKRQEAKKQCQQMAKSFESAFIQTFAKNITEPAPTTVIASAVYTNGIEPKRQRFSGSNSFRSSTVNTDLTLDEDSLDEGLKQHRIYKVLPEKLIAVSSLTSNPQKQRNTRKPQQNEEPEVITCSDDGSDDEDQQVFIDYPCPKSASKLTPKNTNTSMHVLNKSYDKCVICNRVFQRIVHHYINEHKGCEVYTSRLTKAQVTQLRQHTGNQAQQSIYKNGQNQYEGTCAFCQKRSRFMLSYWYQHYTMHTGEYAYRCSGCGTRKPTRSLLQAHVNAPCKKRGTIRQDYKFDSKATQIEARICSICNYIQLHRINIVQHLRTQHNIKDILPKHIITVVLLKWNPTPGAVSTITTVKDSEGAIYEIEELDSGSGSGNYMDYGGIGSDGIIDGVGNVIDNNEMYYDYYGENSGAQFNYDAGDPSDDLSFMICGMLDVQMDTE